MNSVEQAKEKITALTNAHPKANHICFGYRIIDSEHVIEFCSDNGEPSNSAGAPILGQVKSFCVLNTLICVVRYFGGTKLGVSGLINAYKTTAQLTLENSGITIYEPSYRVQLKLKTADFGKVLSYLSKEKMNIVNQGFTDKHEITVQTNTKDLNKIKAKFGSIHLLTWKKNS